MTNSTNVPALNAGNSLLDLLSHPFLAALPGDAAAHFGAMLAEVQRIKDERDEAQGGLTVANMEIDRLRSALTASEKHLELANKLWRLAVQDDWPWSSGETQDALNAMGLLYPKDMTDEDESELCKNCEGECETCWRAVGKLEDVK